MTGLEKVAAELGRYEHALLKFSAREHKGEVELVIEMKQPSLGLHTYYAPVHARDIDHPQFAWTLQRYLYDCMHDYLVEMFVCTPQSRDQGAPGDALRQMTPAGELLAAEIARQGPVSFRRFMEVALYHPQCGYYRRPRDPFGRAGDFFTAEQIQPVFGILMAARMRQLWRAMGEPADFTVVELGAGRGEMAQAFAEWRYVPVEIGSGEMPARFRGVLFSNEFFDALPVEAAIAQAGAYRERRVGFRDGRFFWDAGGPLSAAAAAYLVRYGAPPEDGRVTEINLTALEWLERIAAHLDSGYLLTIDYGYRRAELARFPAGTLMSYRRHQALDDVLENPGERDISAHVNFTALEEHGERCGWRKERFETLAQTILAAGEPDQFAAALHAADAREAVRRRTQLKSLLFGMGETFRVLLQKRESKAEGRI